MPTPDDIFADTPPSPLPPADADAEVLLACGDVRVWRDGKRLHLGNAHLTRSFEWVDGAPRTVALIDAAGRALAAPEKTNADFSFIGITRPGAPGAHYALTAIAAANVPSSLFDARHIKITLDFTEKTQEALFRREYFIYPDFPSLSVRTAVRVPVMPNIYWNRRGDLAGAAGNLLNGTLDRLESCADSLRLAPGLRPVRTVEFRGRTDYHNNPVVEHGVTGECLTGNLLYATDDAGAGFLYLQEAPPSAEKRDWEPYDFRWSDGHLYSCTWGVFPSELRPEIWFQGYRHTLIPYGDEDEGEQRLKAYLRRRFPQPADANRIIMVNPWGCCRFPEIVSEAFLKEEIRACPETGATHYQIDDAWQQGSGLRELFIHNRHMKPDFWAVSRRRLNGTLLPLRAAADKAGIDLGLWIAPSANCEYRDWREFVDIIMGMHRDYGIRIFKIDAVLIRTVEAEENLANLLRTCRERSNGDIYFNLDATNGQRPGYFLFLEYGNIFLANRYVCHPGRNLSVKYHPEKTLRSLWMLSRYVRSQSLQVEVPSPEDILPSVYADLAWTDLRRYPVEYWAAISLFANPLLWFAPSRQSPELRARIKKVMEWRLRFGERLAGSEIYPVGECPTGAGITGFQAIDPSGGTGLLLLFREWGAPESAAVALRRPERTRHYSVLSGRGELKNTEIGAQAVFDAPASYILAEYS